jgi:hypothetical protein
VSEIATASGLQTKARWFGAFGLAVALASLILVLSSGVQYHSPANRLWGHGTCIPDPEYKVNLALNTLAGILLAIAGADLSPRGRLVVGSVLFVAVVFLLEATSIVTWRLICQEVGEG